MLPGWLGGALLIIFGAGVLAVAVQGWRRGELPAGSKGFRAYRPNRSTDPLAFHFFLVLYLGAGFTLTVWGLLMLEGMAAPLKLR